MLPPLKIAMVGTYKGIGGITTHMVQLSKRLQSKGNTVTIFPTPNISSLPSVAYYVNKLRVFDVVHIHGLKDVSPVVFAWLTGEAFKTLTVCTAHGFMPPQWFWRWRKRSVMKTALDRFDAMISVSSYVGDRLARFISKDPPRHFVIPNGVDSARFDPNFDDQGLGKPYKLDGHETVAYLGRLSANKGIQYLIESMKILRARRPTLRLLIGGRGDLEPQLRAIVNQMGLQDVVKFLGFVPQDQIVHFYASADVVAIPSIYEPLSIVALEAMSMERPVVASRVGGIPEIVSDGVTGMLVPPFEPFALANAINKVLSDREFANTLGKKARRVVKESFSWEQVADRTLEAYSLAS